jgi:solute carrier family 7 (L-type amino acid transporter), member 9/15
MTILVLVAPFVRPSNRVGDTPPLPYYLYPLIGIAVTLFGALYWAVWQLVLPHVFKFRLVPRKEVLEDGTVVTLVSQLTWLAHERYSFQRSSLTMTQFSREKVE